MTYLDEIEAWVVAYIEAQSLNDPIDTDHQCWWAVERFMDMHTLEQAEAGWCAILGILERQPPEQVLGMLAAGPLEDLIEDWGPEFIDRIEQTAWNDVQFRNLLNGVWESSSAEIWSRVQLAALGLRPYITQRENGHCRSVPAFRDSLQLFDRRILSCLVERPRSA